MRGVYGIPDPTPAPPRKQRSGWWTIAAIAGLGVATYFIWPIVRPKLRQLADPSTAPPKPSPEPLPEPQHTEPAAATAPASPLAPPRITPNDELEREAHSKGFSSVPDYENSVVLNARQLKKSGATVTLAPHLAHLESRLNG